MSEQQEELSGRLSGIADALTVRTATLIATAVRARLKPEDMDELRHWIGIAVRGAALEGARNAADTMSALVPVPKVGRAHAQNLVATKVDTQRAIPPLPRGLVQAVVDNT